MQQYLKLTRKYSCFGIAGYKTFELQLLMEMALPDPAGRPSPSPERDSRRLTERLIMSH